MACTALKLCPEPIPTEYQPTNFKKLTDAIDRYSPRFRRIALCHLGNVADAEDAVQDAMLSALTHIDQFRGRAQMSTWLTAIVINSARMKLRRRAAQFQIVWEREGKEQSPSLADLIPDARPTPEEAYRKREIVERLAHATGRLSPILRMTFQLRDVDGLSIRETARVLGVPPGTVKARLARARSGIRETIRKKTAHSGVTSISR